MKYWIIILGLMTCKAYGQESGITLSEIDNRLSYKTTFDESLLPKARAASNTLIAYSIEKYFPPVGNQAATPSCVGWASAYYAMTAVKRIEKGIDHPVMSPWSVYNRYQQRKFKNPCSEGCMIEEVLNILDQEGTPTYNDYEFKSCAVDKSHQKYSNTLENWSRIGNSVSQIKSALLLNNPVVIAVPVMQSKYEWSLSSKYIDDLGILKLNSFEQSRSSGGHALCIVAYNDTLQGGAFKIINSWGTDWGLDGFCWLRYADLKYIAEAFALSPSSVLQRRNESAFITDQLSFVNTTDSTLYLSIAYETKTGMISRGWFSVSPHYRRKLDISDRLKNEIFWSALNEAGNTVPISCERNCQEIAVETSKAFELIHDKSNNEKISFLKYIPGNTEKQEEVAIEIINDNEKKEPTYGFIDNRTARNLIEMSKQWAGNTTLIDPLTSEIIIRDPEGKEEISVFILDENNKIQEVKGTPKKISKYKMLKFLSAANAQDYLKSNLVANK